MPKDAAPANPYSRVKFEPLAASLQEALESTRSYLCRQTRSLVVDNTDELVRSITFDIVETYWGIITSGMPNAPYLRPAPHIPSITLLPEETQESVDRLAQLISLLPTIEATYHLGLTYTALLDAQKRNKNGLFYTPPVLAAHLVDRATEELVDWSTARVLEPACGGGVLLTAAAERIIEATWAETGDAAAVLQSISGRLIGYDLDPMGAWLAQVGVDQLLLPFTTETNSKPPALVYQSDMLSLHGSQDFDLVITNPPFRKITLTTDMRLTPAQSEQVTAALSQVGLADLGTRKPATLSGGQQARAALARALLQDRPLVLLDEPFSALGPALKAEMLDLVRDTLAAAGRTVLMVTHDPADALRIADEILFVADGTVTGPHPTRELLDNPPPALSAYLGAK